jgi:hypothetical protein
MGGWNPLYRSARRRVAAIPPARIDAGLSARIGADHLGHAEASMARDRYMSRGRVHHAVAELLEQTATAEPPPEREDITDE